MLLLIIIVISGIASIVAFLFTFANFIGMGLEADYNYVVYGEHVKNFKHSGMYLLISLIVFTIGIYMKLKGF